MPLTVTLARIEKWLDTHAPATAASLRPGADLAAIDATAEQMGMKFLPDLTRLLLWHDGSAALPTDSFELAPGLGFLSLEGIRSAWNIHAQVFDTPDDAPGTRYSSRWIPISTDWCGGHLVIDHRDADTTGKAFFFDPEFPPSVDVHGDTLADLALRQLDALNTGGTFQGRRPEVAAGKLTWR